MRAHAMPDVARARFRVVASDALAARIVANGASMKSPLLLALLASTLLSGCDFDEAMCTPYRSYVANPAQAKRLVALADDVVFSRTLTDADVRSGWLPGPGRAALARREAKALLPEDFAGDEVRLLGDDKFHPDAIMIERKAYHGILLARAGSNAFQKKDDPWLRWTNERVAVECYHEP